MNEADVAIVGAGPAGSLAARRLALAGVRVVLLERATFPREKPCGDGVSHPGLEVLARNGLGEWAAGFSAPEVLRVVAPGGHHVDVRPDAAASRCYGRTIPRRLLDARLAQAAVEAGARLLEGVRVRRVEREPDGRLRVVADGTTALAPLVILADGSLTPITRRMGLAAGETEMVAVRQYLVGDTGPAGRLELHFQRGVVPGYTWIFPLGGGRVNVGSGTFTARTRRGGLDLRAVVRRFIAAPEGRLARAEPVGPLRGHPLRTRLDRARPYADRLLAVGDAAGLVNPLTGEGITPAMESGEVAARHALSALESGDFSASALAAYGRELRRRFLPDQRAARFLRLCLSSARLLDRVVRRMQRDPEAALEVGYVIIGYRPPRTILRPTLLLRLLA